MNTIIEAIYILTTDTFDCILEHVYTSRPPTSAELSSRLRSSPSPLPCILYLPDLIPSTTVYTLTHANLLICSTSSRDTNPLAILTFLQRLVDIFEDFLGSPLLPTNISDNYEVAAQLLNEICDSGIISNTESNALREQVQVSSGLNKLLNQVGLPTPSPSIGPSSTLAATLKAASTHSQGTAIPWRKNNVRHTSNELYVDIVESLSVIYAPSGRPISALAKGSILFTAKISGVPDLILTLSAPGGTSSAKSLGISRTMTLPVFHPCVRLSRWHEHPGELSFIPPDGKFMLAGYESDLLPSTLNQDEPPSKTSKVFLPCTLDMRTNLGRAGNEFSAHLTLNNNFPGIPSSSSISKPTSTSRIPSTTPFSFSNTSTSGSSTAPVLEGVIVSIPFPSSILSVTELKPSRGEAHYNPRSHEVEWRIPTKDGASVSGTATLTGCVTGALSLDDDPDDDNENNNTHEVETAGHRSLSEYYSPSTVDDLEPQSQAVYTPTSTTTTTTIMTTKKRSSAKPSLMPRSITVSFTVKGWLASGIKVDSLVVDVKRSKGLGDGVKPYKGVKYLTTSRRGVERRVG